MIGWKSRRAAQKPELVDPKGFDDFELRLGDIMRGERATLGKSLLDVQRELRIKATYIAAIENCDPTVFDTPGFIAGYVRSYARYLNIDPDEAYAAFCAESGFYTAHGMSEAASTIRRPAENGLTPDSMERDLFAEPNLPFAPSGDSIFSQVEPGAIGSSLVLVALIAGIGYGGWSVLQEVQRVQVVPVDQTPVVLSDLDPVSVASDPRIEADGTVAVQEDIAGVGVFNPPASEALDRLYRPQALDVPVVIARDAPISTLDPTVVGAFADLPEIKTTPALPQLDEPSDTDRAVLAALGLSSDTITASPLAADPEAVTLVAVREAWVRVRGDDNSIIFEQVMNSGDTWQVPLDQDAPRITVGESGALYFAMNGVTYGPSGQSGTVTEDLVITSTSLMAALEPADTRRDADLVRVMAELDPEPTRPVALPGRPKVLEDADPGVTVVAVRPSWVRVTGPGGTTLYEAIMNAGDTYNVPSLAEAPTIRVGESGAIYFAVNGLTYGPAGPRGSVTANLALGVDSVTQAYEVADINADTDLERVVAELNATTFGAGQ